MESVPAEFPRPAATGTLYRSTGSPPPGGGQEPGADMSDDLPGRLPRDRRVLFLGWALVVVAAAVALTVPAARELPSVAGSGDAELWAIVGLAILVDLWAFPGRVHPAVAGAGRAGVVYPSVTFTFALLLGWGLGAAVVAQALAVIVTAARQRQGVWAAVYSQARYALAFVAAAWVLALVDVPRLSEDSIESRPAVGEFLIVLAAGAVWYGVNALLTTTAVWLGLRERWVSILDQAVRRSGRGTLSLLALAPLVVIAGNVNPLCVPLVLVPLFIVGQLTRFTTEEARKASTDELTGLPNRKALYGQVRAYARAHGQRSRRLRGAGDPRRMALLLLDIDQFRRVNEALGHGMGDQLLTAVAARLRAAIGADGLVCRLGGDEFAVLAPRLADLEAAGVLASRVADALTEPIVLDGLPLDVTAAIGVAVYPDHGTDVITLLRHAEIGMYDAKDHAAVYAVYTPEAEQHSPERLELLADLRRALETPAKPGGGDELQLHYQPQVDLATGQVAGAEALLRWAHPVRGFVSPEMIIKIAEHTAMMRRITARVLQDAVEQLAKWRADGLRLRVSVNVSARDLHRGDFADDLARLLDERGVPANQLQLEITEGALMADPRRVLVTLHRLDKLGVALSLDDFGTGFSSMQHLRRLPLAEVKIDKSFVLGMTTDSDDAAIVGSVIDLGRRLGLRVVAEGVEDEETRHVLTEIGCEVGQGWYFARPMPPDAFNAWLATYRDAFPPK